MPPAVLDRLIKLASLVIRLKASSFPPTYSQTCFPTASKSHEDCSFGLSETRQFRPLTRTKEAAAERQEEEKRFSFNGENVKLFDLR